jgi:hypothetical protein
MNGIRLELACALNCGFSMKKKLIMEKENFVATLNGDCNAPDGD